MIPPNKFIAWLGRFKTAETGAAAVEFALILPVMLMLYMGANEASEMISVDRKVQFVSGAVGDLVAQSRDQITAADLENYVEIAGGLMTPYSTTNLEQIVTQLKVLPNGNVVVDWSRGYLNQKRYSALDRAKDSVYPLPADVKGIVRDQYVIMAETRQPARSLLEFAIKGTVILYRVNYYLPRFGNKIELK